MNGTVEGLPNNRDRNLIADNVSSEVAVEVMAETVENNVSPQKDKKKVKGERHDRDKVTVKHHLTNVAHCSTFTFTVLIVYLCFKHPFEFFTWHPLLLSIGWALLMTEAVLVISKENVIPKQMKLSHALRDRYHWIGLTVASILIAIGFVIVTVSKNRNNKEHYKSWHGLFGVIGIIAYIPPCLNGIPLLYRRDIRDYISPKIVKFVHFISGILSLTCGGLSLFLSVYTKWFARHTQGSHFIFYFCLIIVSFPVIWTIQRPLIKCAKMILYSIKPEGKHKHNRA